MRNSALGIDLHSCEIGDVLEALRVGQPDARAEDESLDFKASVTSEPKEIAKDVTSFANRQGGLIIYGIRESGERAAELSPVGLDEKRVVDAYRRKLTQVARPDVPGVELFPKETEPGSGEGILIVAVPPSPMAPHAFMDGQLVRFSFRSGRNNVPMLEGDIERLYRLRWDFLRDLSSALDQIRTRESHEVSSAGELELLAFPVVPIRPGIQLSTLAETLQALQRAADSRAYFGKDKRIRHRRVVGISGSRIALTANGSVLTQSPCSSLNSDGGVWATLEFGRRQAERASPLSDVTDDQVARIPSQTDPVDLALRVARAVFALRDALEGMGSFGDILVRFTVRPNPTIAMVRFGLMAGDVAGVLDEPVEYELQLGINDLRSIDFVGRLIGEIVTDLTSGFGVHPISVSNERGQLRGQFNASPLARWWTSNGLALEVGEEL